MIRLTIDENDDQEEEEGGSIKIPHCMRALIW